MLKLFRLGYLFLLLFVLVNDAQSQIIDHTLFDLYLGDKLQGYVYATYTDEWFEISNPIDVVDQLKTVDPSKHDPIKNLVTGRITGLKEIIGVGSVRFDPLTFRIILSLGEANFLKPDGIKPQFYDSPIVNPSLREDLQVTKVSGQTDAGSYRSVSLASVGSYWSRTEVIGIENQDLFLPESSFNTTFDYRKLSAGLLETRGDRFSPSLSMVGVGLTTINDLVQNDSAIRANTFEVYVPVRSQVDFYRGRRLIDTQLLDFGLQTVDTSRFPDGSYLVDIVIHGAGTNNRITKFFTRSGLLAPRGIPTLTLQAGMLRDQVTGREFTNEPVYQLGFDFRLLDNVQLETAAFGTKDKTIQSLGLRGILDETVFGMGVSNIDNKDHGFHGDLSGKIGTYEFNATYEDSIQFDIEALTDNFNSTNRIPDIFRPIERKEGIRTKLANGSITKRLGDGDLELRLEGFYINTETDIAQYYYGPRVRWRVFENINHRVSFDLAEFKTELGNDTRAVLSYTYRFIPWTLDNSLQYRSKPTQTSTLINSLSYDTKDGRTGLGSRVVGRNEVSVDNDGQGVFDSLEASHGIRVGKGAFYLQNQKTKFGNAHSMGLSADVSVAVDGDGISAAPGELAESLIIVEVNSHSTNSPVDVLINRQKMATIYPNNSYTIGVNPFKKYLVQIAQSEKSDILDYDANEREVIVHPGNITRLSWDIERVVVGYGKVVDENGSLIIKRLLKGSKTFATIDEEGSFQVDIKGGETLTINFEDDHPKKSCSVKIPDNIKEEYFINLGVLICK